MQRTCRHLLCVCVCVRVYVYVYVYVRVCVYVYVRGVLLPPNAGLWVAGAWGPVSSNRMRTLVAQARALVCGCAVLHV